MPHSGLMQRRITGARSGLRLGENLVGPTVGATVRSALAVCLLFGFIGGPAASEAADPAERPFRSGFTGGIFGDIAGADAEAAVNAWGESVLEAAGIPVDPEPLITRDLDALIEAVRRKEIDAVTLETPQLFAFPPGLLDTDHIFINERASGSLVEYVLLVHRDSKLTALKDLRGQSIMMWDHTSSSLALPWVEILLAEQDLPPAAEFFGSREGASALAKTILPVFFKQTAACLVTRSGFNDMAELNPQVGQQLRIVAGSPSVVPTFFCFRAGFDSPDRSEITSAILSLDDTPAGTQILMAFRCERVRLRPGSLLDSARVMYEAYLKTRSEITDTEEIPVVVEGLGGAGR